jgi:hypothetical protein
VSTGTTPTSKSPQFSPSGLLKRPTTRSVRILHHILTTRMELWGFIKSSELYQSVHMKLSLYLSFYLKHRLRGYMVGTTVGFWVEIVEALAPQSHHRTPQKCLHYHTRSYFSHRHVTGSNHPLNRGLRCYCQGKVPRVPWVSG